MNKIKELLGDRLNMAIDVNSNKGEWLSTLTNMFKKVYGFEPIPQNQTHLAKNYKIDNYTFKSWTLGNNNDIFGVFYDDFQNKYEKNFDEDRKQEQDFNIDVKMMDHIPWLEGVDFLKIDNSGYEIETLMGGIDTIKKSMPLIYIENDNDQIGRFLNNVGYQKVDEKMYYK